MTHTLRQNYHKSFETGITASTTQTQGNGSITAAINEIATVVNDGDTITLQSAAEGAEVSIINNGASKLQIFPASGDDLGNGSNSPTTLEAGTERKFFGAGDTKWVDFGSSGVETGSLVHQATATVTTTNNAQTTIKEISLDENSAYLFTAEVIGEVADHSIVLGAIIKCTAKRPAGGSASIVGTVSSAHLGKDSGAASWGVTFTVSGNDLRVSVTGGNSVTVKWECDLNYLKY